MADLRYPLLYQINSRVWLTELSLALGKRATLDDMPDAELDRLAEMGFDWAWFLSVWQTGPAAQAISRANPEWRKEFQETLPDLREEISPAQGSPSKTTPSIAIWAATRRSQVYDSGCKNAGLSVCSILSRTTWRRITLARLGSPRKNRQRGFASGISKS